MSKLVCENFTVKYFGYGAVVSGITTSFFDGINVLYASEKGGKTTLLKGIAGILPYEGELFLDGVDVSTLSLKERDFQMVFDDYALFSRHSVRYNLEYPLKIRKVPKAERKAQVEKVATLFDLDIVIDMPVYRLNEWNKVCLVLCRAYLRDARVLLIDNIFAKLDTVSRKDAFLRFLPLFEGRGIVLYATDSAWEASALSEKIGFLSYGYLLQEGSAEDFHRRPACLAAFSSFEEYPSLLPALIGKGEVTLFSQVLAANTAGIPQEYLEKDAILGLSLGDLRIAENGFDATVKAAFHSGEQRVYLADCEGVSFFFRTERTLKRGDRVTLALEHITAVFDPINQRAIMRYQ